ncbi:MAG TPA: DUF1294 domain-containing protein [Albidovulum sp.]|uniref:DUF1294 domain-containing protein n=1 Tax=Albidovulum sp. TaxID=1872424 RepID=UPI002C8EB7EA|nr:DUF1294 domain-containing protein [Albidovulum sp.]
MTTALGALLFLLYLVAVSIFSYALFAIDKWRAQNREWRISEAALLTTALVGGSLGAKLAQHRLRHKTRKEPFRSALNLICLLQAAALASLFFPAPRAAAIAVFGAITAGFPTASEVDRPLPRRFGPGS